MKKIILLFLPFFLLVTPLHAASNTLNATVTITNTNSYSISPYIWGVNIAEKWPLDENYYFSKFNENTIKSWGIKEIRFPAGCSADFYNWKTHTMHYLDPQWGEINTSTMSVDEALSFADKISAELLYTVNITTRPHTDSCGKTPVELSTVQDIADLVNTYKDKIKNYELGNEQFAGNWTASDYEEVVLPIARAMKNIDSTIKLGLVGYPTNNINDPNFIAWNEMLSRLKEQVCNEVLCFDFVNDHVYVTVNTPQELANFPILEADERMTTRKNIYSPLNVGWTEWNAVCWQNSPSLFTVGHGLFAAENLLLMAKNQVERSDLYSLNFNDIGNLCGITNPDNPLQINTMMKAFTLTSPLAGGKFLPSNTDNPIITTYAGISADSQKSFIFLFNKSETQDANVSLQLDNFPYADLSNIFTQKVYKAANFSTSDFEEDILTQNYQEPLNLNLPPVSLTRIEFAKPEKAGDTNNDELVDGIDYITWIANYGKTTQEGNKEADFDQNHIVDDNDYFIWLTNFLTQ